jgi:Fe(3+) dicitrate transport protein
MNTTVYHHFLTRAWTKLNRFAGGPALHDLLLNPDGGQAAVYAGILRGEEDSISADQVLQIGTNDRRFHSVGMQWLARHKMRSDEIANEFEVGVRLHADYVTRLHTEVPYNMLNGSLVPEGSEASTVLDSMTNAHALAIHAHNDFAWRRLHIVPGMRLETIWNAAGTSETGPTDPVLRVVPLPGLGLMGEPLPWLGVFGGVHRGFSPVGPGQDPEIQPESSWSYELGVRAVPGESHVELVGFLSDYTNLSGQCTLSGGCDQDQVDQQFNGGQAWVYGAEALASHRLRLRGGIDLYGEMTYTYTYTAFRTGFISGFAQFGTVSIGDALPYVPEHQGGLRLEASHRLGVLSIASHGRSAMRDIAGQGEIADDELIPGVIQLDAALRTNVTDRLTLYVNGTNLTGAKTIASWRPFGARPIAPRQVMGGIEVSL